VPIEKTGQQATIRTADHPPRSESARYKKSRQWLMDETAGGCVLCGGESDLTHPGGSAQQAGLQDHHGGGIYVTDKTGGRPVLVGFTLFPIEWSEGWGADPTVVADRVTKLGALLRLLGQPGYDQPIKSVSDVMNFTDSVYNANVKLCAAHHVGLEQQDAKDANGHQAVGIHSIPFPVWAYQGYCDWAHWNMWAGTTGTIAVAPKKGGGARLIHMSPLATAIRAKNRQENAELKRAWQSGRHNITLPESHNLVQAARLGG
jgi:hypothetical protein